MYAWEGGPALVQTVDFFTPIVDDPYLYGQIAAANSLSDVYAMGGRPLTALAIAAFPQDGLHTDDIAQIFRGGFDKLREAGVALLGGHTVQDREIKFGYAVTGAIDPKRILTNAGAKPGDRLILTKPLGTGIVGTAIKFGRAPQDVIDHAVAQMRTLNKAAAEAIAERRRRSRVHRHHRLRPRGSRIGNGRGERRDDRVRRERVADHSRRAGDGRGKQVRRNEHQPGTLRGRGSNSVGTCLSDSRDLIFDPQTSGGLLVSVGVRAQQMQCSPA